MVLLQPPNTSSSLSNAIQNKERKTGSWIYDYQHPNLAFISICKISVYFYIHTVGAIKKTGTKKERVCMVSAEETINHFLQIRT